MAIVFVLVEPQLNSGRGVQYGGVGLLAGEDGGETYSISG
jgi:hypothetical protein